MKRWGLAAALLAPVAADADPSVQVFDVYAQVIVHGDDGAQARLARYLRSDTGPTTAAALAAMSHLEQAPELVDWPRAAAAVRKRQRSADCSTDSVRYPQANTAEVSYRCRLPDLSALLPVYRQHPVPFGGPHPPQMAHALASAYTRAMAMAPTHERRVMVTFNRDRDDTVWRIGNPTPLIATVADAFLPFLEWNEHLPDETP